MVKTHTVSLTLLIWNLNIHTHAAGAAAGATPGAQFMPSAKQIGALTALHPAPVVGAVGAPAAVPGAMPGAIVAPPSE